MCIYDGFLLSPLLKICFFKSLEYTAVFAWSQLFFFLPNLNHFCFTNWLFWGKIPPKELFTQAGKNLSALCFQLKSRWFLVFTLSWFLPLLDMIILVSYIPLQENHFCFSLLHLYPDVLWDASTFTFLNFHIDNTWQQNCFIFQFVTSLFLFNIATFRWQVSLCLMKIKELSNFVDFSIHHLICFFS